MRAHFCGTRGSTPAPGTDYVRYGGHTSCLALTQADASGPRLLLDAGTGLRLLPSLLGAAPFAGTILLTHLHWDHVQGLPFFESGDRADSDVTLLVPAQEDGTEAEQVLMRMMSPPLFPIRPKDLRGQWTFDDVPAGAFTPGGIEIEGFMVTAREVPHKGGRTLGYRVQDRDSTLAYIPDHCPTSLGAGPSGFGELHEAALELARDVDVLVHDAHLVADELAEQGSFGHAAAEYAVELARAAGAAQVMLFHHSPDRTDDQIDAVAQRLTTVDLPVYGARQGSGVDLVPAR